MAMGISDLAIAFTKLDNDELTDEERLDLFQDLVDTGLAWTMPGRIGREAAALIKGGYIMPPERE